MAKVAVNLQLSKESYELSKGVADLINAIKTAVEDGWQPGKDIPVIMTEVIARLVPALAGVEKIVEEFKLEPVDSSLAISIPLVQVISSFLKKAV